MTELGLSGNLQVKIFTQGSNWGVTLSEAINDWLNSNPGLLVMDMQYQTIQTNSGNARKSVLIIFKKEGSR